MATDPQSTPPSTQFRTDGGVKVLHGVRYVCVVILNWNNAPDTLKCLDSILESDYSSFSVVTIDNGSTDDSAEIIRRHKPRIPLVETHRNLGYAAGNNLGIRLALETGARYVLILNNDVVVSPPALTELVSVAEADESIGIVGPAVYFYDDPETICEAGNRIEWPGLRLMQFHRGVRSVPDCEAYEVDYASGCALLVKREVFDGVGLFDERFFLYFEETDFCLRSKMMGYRTVIVPWARVWHKISSSNGLNSPLVTYYMTRNQFLLIRNARRGRQRILSFVAAATGETRTLLACTLKPRCRRLDRMRILRIARYHGLRDGLLGRYGPVGLSTARSLDSAERT